jgi:hypothetical protein
VIGLTSHRPRVILSGTGSKAPKPCVSVSSVLGQPVNKDALYFCERWTAHKTTSLGHRSNTYALAALAVGGKLTKRVHGSFECRGDRRASRGAARLVAERVTSHAGYHGWQMTRPNRGKVELCPFLRFKGKGDGFDPCCVRTNQKEQGT